MSELALKKNSILWTVFKFCASLQLALVLLIIIIAASAAGTILETRLNADVARKYIYNAPWFNLWLTMLCVNLFCVAAIRYPWKPHQTGFVITHAGIIILLVGGMLDREFGIEGYLNLRRGNPPSDIMELHEQMLKVSVAGTNEPAITTFKYNDMLTPEERKFPAKSPSPEVKVEIEDITPIEEKSTIVAGKGQPAISFTLQGSMMGTHDFSLFLNHQDSLGPASVHFLQGMPPGAAAKKKKVQNPDEMVPRLERYFVFSKYPQPMGSTLAGEPTNCSSKLIVDDAGQKPELELGLFGKTYHVPIKPNLKKDFPLDGLAGWHLTIQSYFSNFRMIDKKPVNVNDSPDNPAVLFELTGPLVRAGDTPEKTEADPHGSGSDTVEDEQFDANALAFYLGDDNVLRYYIRSRKNGSTSGDVEIGKAVPVSWAPGAQFIVRQFLPSAEQKTSIEPIAASGDNMEEDGHTIALHCKVTVGKDSQEVWVPQSNVQTKNEPASDKPSQELVSSVPIQVGDKKVDLAFSNRWVHLPFKVSLEKFMAQTDEGSTSFREFESTLSFANQKDTIVLKPDAKLVSEHIKAGKVEGAITAETDASVLMEFDDRTSLEIARADIASMTHLTHRIHMNVPTTFPVTQIGPWTGTDYKFSQANHHWPMDKDYSGVQVLRDPGWMFKWVGCLMICFGIFTMFYLKPYFKRGVNATTANENPRVAKDTALASAELKKRAQNSKPAQTVK